MSLVSVCVRYSRLGTCLLKYDMIITGSIARASKKMIVRVRECVSV